MDGSLSSVQHIRNEKWLGKLGESLKRADWLIIMKIFRIMAKVEDSIECSRCWGGLMIRRDCYIIQYILFMPSWACMLTKLGMKSRHF